MSISNSYPTQTPSLNLNFATGSDQFLDSRISFSRADTPPTYAAPSAVHYWSNEKHLSSENLLLQSQDFDTTWLNDGGVGIASVTGSQTAPDGTSTAWLVTADTFTGGASRLQQSIPISTNTEYTMVAHVKAGTASHAWMSFRGASSQSCSVTLNFATQALTNTAYNFTSVSSSVTALGNSWFKLTLTGTTDNSTANPIARVGISDGSAVLANGNAEWNASGETIYAWGIQLSSVNSLVYDSPTTTQISREYSSTLKSVANAGDPRFEFDPADGQSVGTALGLLVESQSTNYNIKSEDIAGWSAPGNMTISANSMVAPNGTLTADVLTVSDDTVASGHFAYRSVTGGSSGDSVAVSFYAKSTGVDEIYFYDSGGGTNLSIFNLANGTVSGTNSANSKITDCGNGWYHCVGVYTLVGGSPSLRFYSYNGTTTTYIANGFDGFALWGVQVEIGVSSESSYISTSGSTVSRASDSCSVATSSFYTGGPVSIVAEANMTSPTMNPPTKSVFELGDGTSDNRIWVYNNFSKADSLYVRADGVTGMFEAGTITTDDDFTVAVRVDTNNSGRSTNGGSVTSDTSVIMPSGLDTLYIGRSKSSSGNQLNGHFKRLSLFNVALSDTELKTLTSS